MKAIKNIFKVLLILAASVNGLKAEQGNEILFNVEEGKRIGINRLDLATYSPQTQRSFAATLEDKYGESTLGEVNRGTATRQTEIAPASSGGLIEASIDADFVSLNAEGFLSASISDTDSLLVPNAGDIIKEFLVFSKWEDFKPNAGHRSWYAELSFIRGNGFWLFYDEIGWDMTPSGATARQNLYTHRRVTKAAMHSADADIALAEDEAHQKNLNLTRVKNEYDAVWAENLSLSSDQPNWLELIRENSKDLIQADRNVRRAYVAIKESEDLIWSLRTQQYDDWRAAEQKMAVLMSLCKLKKPLITINGVGQNSAFYPAGYPDSMWVKHLHQPYNFEVGYNWDVKGVPFVMGSQIAYKTSIKGNIASKRTRYTLKNNYPRSLETFDGDHSLTVGVHSEVKMYWSLFSDKQTVRKLGRSVEFESVGEIGVKVAVSTTASCVAKYRDRNDSDAGSFFVGCSFNLSGTLYAEMKYKFTTARREYEISGGAEGYASGNVGLSFLAQDYDNCLATPHPAKDPTFQMTFLNARLKWGAKVYAKFKLGSLEIKPSVEYKDELTMDWTRTWNLRPARGFDKYM